VKFFNIIGIRLGVSTNSSMELKCFPFFFQMVINYEGNIKFFFVQLTQWILTILVK
jgi:hypothetical protein